MPRKVKAEQEGRFAQGRKASNRTQWPYRSVWGSGRYADTATENWFSKRECRGQDGCPWCVNRVRVRGLRVAYGKKKGRN